MKQAGSVFATKWAEVFAKYDVLQTIEKQGYADLTSEQIKAVKEPRLLTKIDHSVHLPPVMEENGLSILSLSLSRWRIGPFDVFRKLPEFKTPDVRSIAFLSLPSWITSIDPAGITNEGSVMAAAFGSGMLQEFCGEDLVLTIQGKGRVSPFDFKVGKTNGDDDVLIKMTGTQIEVDAGYEGHQALWLFEAKRRLGEDFNVRQLYYPFRGWRERVKKPVRLVYLIHASEVFEVMEYEFTDPQNFSSSALVAHARYMLNATLPTESEVVGLAKSAVSAPQPVPTEISFPQADSFERIIDLVEFLNEGEYTVDEIALEYEFDPRQSDYYFNAARYLGLAQTKPGKGVTAGQTLRTSTPAAAELLALPYREKRLGFAARALAVQPVAQVFLEVVGGGSLNVERCQELFEASPTSTGLTGSTLRRRAQTVRAWAQWLLDLDGK